MLVEPDPPKKCRNAMQCYAMLCNADMWGTRYDTHWSLPTWRLALAKGNRRVHWSGEHRSVLSHGLPEVTRSPASQASLWETSKSASPPEVKPSPRATGQSSTNFNKVRKGKWKRLEKIGKDWKRLEKIGKKTQLLTKAQATTGGRVSKLLQV